MDSKKITPGQRVYALARAGDVAGLEEFEQSVGTKVFQSQYVNFVHGKNSNQTPLWTAAKYGRVKAVRFLLSRGANPALKDTAMQWNSLHIAVSEGKTLVVADICEKTPELVNFATPEGFSPLYLASLNGKTACARGLLQAGANVKQYGILRFFSVLFRSFSNFFFR
jgi:hypothetical protein